VGRAIGLSRQGARQRYRHVMAEMQEVRSGTDGSTGWAQPCQPVSR
jgi:hypothetical protein